MTISHMFYRSVLSAGSWERSSLARSARLNPELRFPLNDTGLSGQFLSTARDICALWNNDKWINQAPLPGLSPISLNNTSRNAVLRQIAELTRVKPGEEAPDGFPPMFLRALQQAIKERLSSSIAKAKGAKGALKLVHSVDLPRALAILKNGMAPSIPTSSSSSTSVDNRPSKKMKIESLLNPLSA